MGGKQWTILTISGYDPLNILGPAGHKNTNKIQVGGHHRHTTLLMTVKYGPNLVFIMKVTDRDEMEAKTITILGFTKAFNSENQKEIKDSKEAKFSQLL